MSHTDKDLPYWVRLNNEGIYTDHDHLRFGKEVVKRVLVKDEFGRPVEEEVPKYRRASVILERMDFGYGQSEYLYSHYSEEIRRKARELVAQARGRELVEVGTEMRYVYKSVVTGVVYDYCTQGMKLPDDTYRWWNIIPCTPELPAGNRRLGYTRYMSGAKKSYSRVYYSARRIEARDSLIGAKNAYNSGEDIDDFDETPLTRQTRHSMAWDLY